MLNKRTLVLVLLISVLFTPSAWALTKGFEAISFRPATNGPYFNLWGSQNLKGWQFSTGTYATYAYRPFQLTQGRTRIGKILDHTLVQNVYGAVGLVDRWLQIGFELPIGWWVRFTDPNIAGAATQTKQTVGDLRVYLKSELIELEKHNVGLSLLPFISIPTGYGKYYFGNGSVTGGGKLIAEVKPVNWLRIALNAGVMARERFDFRDIEKSNQLLYGVGTSARFSKYLSAVAEVNGQAKLSGLFQERQETPVEAIGGLKWAVGGSGLVVGAGGGFGIIKGAGVPTFRTFVGLGYQAPPRKSETPKPDLTPVNQAIILYPVDGLESTEETGALLGQVADLLISDPSARIQIIGYSDDVGGKNLNQIVSEKRAETVKWYLELRGVNANRMEAIGMGEADPRGDNRTPEGRAANRRVEFRIIED